MWWLLLSNRCEGAMKRKCFGLSLILVAAVSCAAFAQQAARLEVLPSEGKSVGLVRTSSAGRWFVLGPKLAPVQSQAFRLSAEAGGGSIIFWEGAPGDTFTVLCVPDNVTEGWAATAVKLGGTGPVDPDDPDPPPDPDAQADQVTIVTESQETLPAQQQEIVNGEGVRSAAKAAGLKFHAIDKDTTGPDVQRIGHVLAACKGKPVPRLVFSRTGKVIANEPLPATVAQTLALIKKYGGKP